MTDTELLNRVIGALDPGQTVMRQLRRNGRLLLAVPGGREAAARTFGLYQPQRRLARGMMGLLRGLASLGIHGCLLPKIRIAGNRSSLVPALAGVEAGTCGVLLGSPEHRIQRAIACYRHEGRWEVAKISFGDEGRQILEVEAQALVDLQSWATGVPHMLGLHRGEGLTVLRMPYLTGKAIPTGEYSEALDLLNQWVTHASPRSITSFPEWAAIESALEGDADGSPALEQLSRQHLVPVICHGDFARWNLLKQANGALVALDWEWGHNDGMPGLDLVHYFLQDHRLVRRLEPNDAIAATLHDLQRPECAAYLKRTGWSGAPILPIIASLAYKQGAGHQENAEMLEKILDFKF